MILADIRSYLVNQQSATLNDLANHFETDPETIRAMLQIWINKGKIIKLPPQKGCGGGCSQCHCSLVESYQWVMEIENGREHSVR